MEVRYRNGSQWVVDTIAANTDRAPAVAVFNHRLHVFWRDQGNGAIKLTYYNPYGQTWSYDLSSLGLSTGGPFDAYPFNSNLYLGFARPGSNTVNIARCKEPTYGYTSEASDWVSWSGKYYKDLGWVGAPGLALSASDDLNGAPSGSHLYVATVGPRQDSSFGYKRIYVFALNTKDSVVSFRFMPNVFPSFRAAPGTVMGADVRPSAFPSVGDYLYLTWRDDENGKIHVSILQN